MDKIFERIPKMLRHSVSFKSMINEQLSAVATIYTSVRRITFACRMIDDSPNTSIPIARRSAVRCLKILRAWHVHCMD